MGGKREVKSNDFGYLTRGVYECLPQNLLKHQDETNREEQSAYCPIRVTETQPCADKE